MPLSIRKSPKKAPKKKKGVSAEESTPKTTGKKAISNRKKGATKLAEDANLTPTQRWVKKMKTSSRFKDTQIQMASEMQNPFTLRRPTGKLGLDIALGGGYHAGGIVEIQGAQSVGKTREYWEAIAQLQAIYGEETRVLIAATELRPDKDQARLSGCCIAYSQKEISEMEIARGLKGEPGFTPEEMEDLQHQIGEIYIVMAPTAEKLFDVIIEALEENIFQMIVIDSMGALLPKAKDDTASLSEKTYGGASVPVTDFVNKVYPLLIMDRGDGTMTETTVLAINQARARIGGSQWERKTKEAMGAYAWKHGQLVNILFERGSKIRHAEGGPPVGFTVKWEIIKGKAGTHDGKRGSYDYEHFQKRSPVFWKEVQDTWLGGVAIVNEHVETAKELGIVEGSTWLSFTRPNGEVIRGQGIDNFAQALAENPEVLQELRDACFKKAGIYVRHK